MVNLDFEDLKSIVNSGAGVAMIGLGSAKGPGEPMLRRWKRCTHPCLTST